jgi:hypothetical protein
MDGARLKLEEEKRVLEALRDTLDASNAIKVLEEECKKELGHLEDAVADETSRFHQFNIPTPMLPKDDDDSGDRLIQVLDATGKYRNTSITTPIEFRPLTQDLYCDFLQQER